MNKIKLTKEIAKEFCYEYNEGDYGALYYLKAKDNQSEFLDLGTRYLLESLISMNVILSNYLWCCALDSFEEEAQPTFTEAWLYDLENKYYDSKDKLLERFDNIRFNEYGELEVIEEA